MPYGLLYTRYVWHDVNRMRYPWTFMCWVYRTTTRPKHTLRHISRRLLQCCGVVAACVLSVDARFIRPPPCTYDTYVYEQYHLQAVTQQFKLNFLFLVHPFFSLGAIHSLGVGINADQSGYTLEVVQDARDYADHAGRTDIGMEDVRLAVRKKQDALSAGPPTREVRVDLAACL